MLQLNELRLVVRVARMYYEQEMKQAEIARQLGLSQPTVSRLLAEAKEAGVIRISVAVPHGLHTELEEKLLQHFPLRDAVVVDCSSASDERTIEREIGGGAAYYLESTVRPNEVLGVSSWSSTLLAVADAMHAVPRKGEIRVVQILGGVGDPLAEKHASRLTSRFATLLGGQAIYLPAPGVVGSAAALAVIQDDIYVREVTGHFGEVTTALVGIGAIEPSTLLAASGNVFSQNELELLRANQAVGDVLLRFYDSAGRPVITPLNERVVSMRLEQLAQVDRSIGVAGGQRKWQAILGALRGRWINVLITDQYTAQWLAAQPSAPPA